MRTNKILIDTDEFTQIFCFEKTLDMSEEELIKNVKKIYSTINKPNINILQVFDANKYHTCKYCGNVVEGNDDDELCAECQELFGHTHYSEL